MTPYIEFFYKSQKGELKSEFSLNTWINVIFLDFNMMLQSGLRKGDIIELRGELYEIDFGRRSLPAELFFSTGKLLYEKSTGRTVSRKSGLPFNTPRKFCALSSKKYPIDLGPTMREMQIYLEVGQRRLGLLNCKGFFADELLNCLGSFSFFSALKANFAKPNLLLTGLHEVLERNDSKSAEFLKNLKCFPGNVVFLLDRPTDLVTKEFCMGAADKEHFVRESSIIQKEKLSPFSIEEIQVLETMLLFENDLEVCRKKLIKQSAGRVPMVRWEDIGGLQTEKQELRESWRRGRKGILLHGPPGTGKTLIAKAVASEFDARFRSIKGPEILDKYIGESEHNLREIFKTAEEEAPCVLFFDEIDSVCGRRGGRDSQVLDRIVAQFCSLFDQSKGIFVLAATNRVDLLDDFLLRPGRFDKAKFNSTQLALFSQ